MTRHWSEETRWQPLSEAVARLKAQVEAAYHASNEAAANEAHEDLLAAEHRCRMAERRMR